MLTNTLKLTLADLEAHDPKGGRGPEHGRRWRCPVCRATERSLSVNTATGAYNCKRASCGAVGKLADFHDHAPRMAPAARARLALAHAFDAPPSSTTSSASSTPTSSTPDAWRQVLAGARDLEATPGRKYLEGRGLSLGICKNAGAKYLPNWFGRAAVMFPIHDRAGQVVAAQGRYISPEAKPKARRAGALASGVFLAPWAASSGRVFGPLDAEAPAVIVC